MTDSPRYLRRPLRRFLRTIPFGVIFLAALGLEWGDPIATESTLPPPVYESSGRTLDDDVAPPPAPAPTTSTTTTAPPPVRITATVRWVEQTAATTTTTLVPDDALCGEWWVTALAVGWTRDELPTLDRIMWNESRCQPEVSSSTNDHGLVQINWTTWASLVERLGYDKTELYNPAFNLAVGKMVSQQAVKAGWCKYQPWHGFSGNYCG
jgi:hypothetical protein